MSKGSGLPPGWARTDLATVTVIRDDLRQPVNAAERANRVGPYPYYGATGQVGWIDGYRMDGEYVLLGEDGAPFLDSTKAKAYLVSGKCWVNNHAHVLYGVEGITDNRFLMYALNATDYHDFVSGTTRLKLTQGAMKQIPIGLPPPAEQRRIVAAIEEQFTRLDAGVAALERAQKGLKRYRASVLKAAVEGRLTKEWREENPDAESGSALLERILQERRAKWEEAQLGRYAAKEQNPPKNWRSKYKEPSAPDTASLPELPEGWSWASMDSLLEFMTSGSRGWARYYAEHGAMFIRMGNLDHDTIALDLAHVQRVDPPAGSEGTREHAREVRPMENGFWSVPSCSGRKPYAVDLESEFRCGARQGTALGPERGPNRRVPSGSRTP